MDYIINMLAKPETVTTTQTGVSSPDAAVELYIKNSLVCFSSLRINGGLKEMKLLLFINWDMSAEWRAAFEKEGVELIYLPFGKYAIGSSFAWGIVQYRYDVMEYLSEHLDDMDRILMLDTDIYCAGSLRPLFEEMDDRLLLYDVQHSCDNPERKVILDNLEKIYGERRYFTHWGGEFTGCRVKTLRRLFEGCRKVMVDSAKVSDLVNFNDEHITSAAADRDEELKAAPANAYVCRFWTIRNFYLSGTNYRFNRVVLWHMPAEKKRTMLWLYDHYIKNGSYPSDEKIARIMGLPKAAPRESVARYVSALKYRKVH